MLCCPHLLQVNSTVDLYDSEFVIGRKSKFCWSRCVSNIPSSVETSGGPQTFWCPVDVGVGGPKLLDWRTIVSSEASGGWICHGF